MQKRDFRPQTTQYRKGISLFSHCVTSDPLFFLYELSMIKANLWKCRVENQCSGLFTFISRDQFLKMYLHVYLRNTTNRLTAEFASIAAQNSIELKKNSFLRNQILSKVFLEKDYSHCGRIEVLF